MIVIAVFIGLLTLAAGYAQWRGGAPEKLAATAMFGAMLATLWVGSHAPSFNGTQWELLVVDFGLFVALCLLANFADRFWPMWLAAFQLVAVASHGASAYNPGILPVAYWWIVGKISYPMIAILVIGTLRHDRRKRLGGPEFGWTHERHRARAGSGERQWTS